MFGRRAGSVDTTRGLSTARTFPVSVTVTAAANALDTSNARRRREHMQIDPDLLRQMGISTGFAVRNHVVLTVGSVYAVYTVEICETQTSITTVRVSSTEGLARLPAVTFPVAGTLTEFVPSTSVSEQNAIDGGLYYEFKNDNGTNVNIVIAPHGGAIELWTDEMAAEMKVALDAAGKTSSTWGGIGYALGGQSGADRWHITSVDIDQRKLPMLTTVFRDYTRVISLHGQSASNRIDLGGPVALNTFIDSLVSALQAKAELSGITVARTEDSEIAGQSLNNIGNRLCPTSGHYVQVEMSPEVRSDATKRAAVVSAFATAYAAL